MLRKRLGTKSFEIDALRLRVQQGATGNPPGTGAWDFYRIWVIHNSGEKPEDFDVSAAGLTAALAVTDASDVIWMPPCSIALDFTLPAGAGMASMANDAIIVGTVTMGGQSSYLQSMVIAPSGSSGSDIVGLVGPASGEAIAANCIIQATNNGAGRALAVTAGLGQIDLLLSKVRGYNEGSGTGAALANESTGLIRALECELEAHSSGADSTPFLYGGGGEISLVSAVGEGKAFSLWNGTSNDPPPANWETEAFNDSAWTAPIATPYPPALVGTEGIKGNYSHPEGAKHLIRHSFSVTTPADTRLQMRIEDQLTSGVYLNGIQVVAPVNTPSTGSQYNSVDEAIDSSELQAGTNVLAMEVQNGDGYALGVCYRMDILGGAGGQIEVYACQFGEQYADDCSYLPGDRSAYDIERYDFLHGTDIYNNALLRHLPDPTGQPDGYIAYILNDHWVIGPDSDITIPEFDELRIESTKAAKGSSAPTDALRDVGASGTLKMPVEQFSKTVQQDVYFTFHYPTNIDFTQDVEFHLMWIPGAGWTSGNYMWKLEYLTKNENGGNVTTGTPTTIQADVTPASADLLIETHFADTITINDDEILICHFYRDVANDNADDVGEVLFFEIGYWTAAEEGDVLTDDDLETLTDDDDSFLTEA